jgi:hypothetical protein
MAYIVGPHDDKHGEPSRTACRVLLLRALGEAMPGLVADLREACGGAPIGYSPRPARTTRPATFWT